MMVWASRLNCDGNRFKKFANFSTRLKLLHILEKFLKFFDNLNYGVADIKKKKKLK